MSSRFVLPVSVSLLLTSIAFAQNSFMDESVKDFSRVVNHAALKDPKYKNYVIGEVDAVENGFLVKLQEVGGVNSKCTQLFFATKDASGPQPIGSEQACQ